MLGAGKTALIRGGHYGQRSCEPHLKAEHTGAPTNAANVKKVLATSEPSTHGDNIPSFSAFDPKVTSTGRSALCSRGGHIELAVNDRQSGDRRLIVL